MMKIPKSESIPAEPVENVPHPGALIRGIYLEEMGMTPQEFAQRIGMPVQTIADLLDEKSRMTLEMAMRIGKALGTGSQIWMNAQHAFDDGRELKQLRESGGLAAVDAVSVMLE